MKPALHAVGRRTPAANLAQRAELLWPDSEALQREWLRAVGVVRRTRRGWLMDRPVQRTAPEAA